MIDDLRMLRARKTAGVTLIAVGAAAPLGLIAFTELVGGVLGLAFGGLNGLGAGLVAATILLFNPTFLLPVLLVVAAIGLALVVVGAAISAGVYATRPNLEAELRAANQRESSREEPAPSGPAFYRF